MAEQNEQNASPQGEAPVFRLQKLYLKDLSFENPNAPEIYLEQQQSPKVEVNLGLKNKKMENDHWEVCLSVTATVTNGKDGKTLFIVEVEHAGVFVLKNIPEEHLPMVLAVDCPTLLFPFTRQIMSQVSIDGGFAPFLMEPVNFMALFQSAKKKQQQQAQQQQ
ncbi:MAG: protein-export chaperone SecB [Desulfobulbaceae bacterium DB1]|nr:MAG: protein-export chaperone SecB [Desulfobulbaceae bacterium DB1]